MKNFLRHTLWQEEFASGRMGRALDILLLFFLPFFFSVLLVNLTRFRDDITDISPDLRLDFWVWSFSSRRRDG